MTYFEQGDVLIKEVTSIPVEAKTTSNKVLAHGESGHIHQFKGDTAQMYVLNDLTYLKVFKDTPIEHEEHKTIIIPKGAYQIDRVKEYDHFIEEARYVAD